MNFNCISISTLYIILAIILIAIIIALIPIVKWYKWKINLKAKIKAKKKDTWYKYCNVDYSFFYWIKGINVAMFAFGIGFALAMAIYLCLPFREIYSNRVNEPFRYSAAIAEAKTLTEVLDVSEDIVNTDLYIRVVDYNTNLASIKSKFNNNDFRLNFSGNYDWNSLESIELK